MGKEYVTANIYGRRTFGSKVYKLALSAATSCPNRDGTIGFGGCTFCSAGGSGDFAAPAQLPLQVQLDMARNRVGKKGADAKYLAYFQSFTGTHGDLDILEQRYREAAEHQDIVGLSIATRPDALGEDALAMLKRLGAIKPLWVELGLQTIHETTAQRIHRGYALSVYEEAMDKLNSLGVHRITHVILGLPGESRGDMLQTVKFVGERTDGIKLQLLHVLQGTQLAEEYQKGEFEILEPIEYYQLLGDAIECLPDSVVIHRLTGDGAKKDLIAPLWSGNKKRVLVDLKRILHQRGIYEAEL